MLIGGKMYFVLVYSFGCIFTVTVGMESLENVPLNKDLLPQLVGNEPQGMYVKLSKGAEQSKNVKISGCRMKIMDTVNDPKVKTVTIEGNLAFTLTEKPNAKGPLYYEVSKIQYQQNIYIPFQKGDKVYVDLIRTNNNGTILRTLWNTQTRVDSSPVDGVIISTGSWDKYMILTQSDTYYEGSQMYLWIHIIYRTSLSDWKNDYITRQTNIAQISASGRKEPRDMKGMLSQEERQIHPTMG